MREVVKFPTEVIDSLEVRNTAIPEHIQANVLPLAQPKPYGEDYGMEAPVPVLMQPMEASGIALTPRAPPGVSNDQALRSHPILSKEEDQANQGPAINPELKTIKDLSRLRKSNTEPDTWCNQALTNAR